MVKTCLPLVNAERHKERTAHLYFFCGAADLTSGARFFGDATNSIEYSSSQTSVRERSLPPKPRDELILCVFGGYCDLFDR